MSYILGDITLPNPKELIREPIEISKENLLLNGRTSKKIIARKERFTIVFEFLTQSQVNQILSEVDLDAVRSFEVDEDNLSIGPTDVHINLGTREYNVTGPSYRENLSLVLTEVT